MNWTTNRINGRRLLIIILTTMWIPASAAGKLINVDQLHDLMSGGHAITILDVRPAEAYTKGHIPGALQIWQPDFTDTLSATEGMMASREQMEQSLGNLGIEPGSELVLYDDKALCHAARLWWILEYYGYSGVKLLNGGMRAWLSKGYELSRELSATEPVSFFFTTSNKTRHAADLNEVRRALDNPGITIVDARSKEEYTGSELSRHASRRGRIPGSVHIDWASTVNFEGDHTFKPIAAIKKLYHDLGVTPDKNLIVYCRSGVRSAHTTFVLTQLLGYERVRNYDGSWMEWSSMEELPTEGGETVADPTPQPDKKNYLEIIEDGYTNYANYLWHEITHPGWHSYFYWLILVSAFFFLIELFFPWRKGQKTFRKDFWLDFFYMFFNFFLFSLVIFNAASDVVVNLFNDALASIGIHNLVAFEVQTWPIWAHLLLGFVVRDFVQWWIHRLLHRVPFLWQFHKVHHSVEQMGFAAHLRFHWMENVVYRTIEYIPLALIGIGLNDFFIIHIFALTIGHWNHSNFKLNIGPLKYIFNNPQMHIWHHARDIPKEMPYGVNFGLTLSVWDYLFKTDYIPYDGRDIKLGFPGDEQFPHDFVHQNIYGFGGHEGEGT